MAYNLMGPKWSDTTITWSFVAPQGATFSRPAITSAIDTPVEQAQVAKSLAAWASVSGLTFQHVADATTGEIPDIRIGFADFTNGGQFAGSSGQMLGTAYSSWSGLYFKPGAMVVLQDPTYWGWNVDAAGQATYVGTQVSAQQVLTHEIGHALGLQHSDTPDDLMYDMVSGKNLSFSADDIQGIQALYGAPAVVVPPVVVPPVPPVDPTLPVVATINAMGPVQDLGLWRHDAAFSLSLTTGGLMGNVSNHGQTVGVQGAETLRFLDGTLTFDDAAPLAQVWRLYQSGLGRLPEGEGLHFWSEHLQSDMSLNVIAQNFLSSAEGQARFGAASSAIFVESLYNNALGRASDAAGLQSWTAKIDQGQLSRAEVFLSFSESTEMRYLTADTLSKGLWDIDHQAAQAARLYVGLLDRSPDAQGLLFQKQALENGVSFKEVASNFLTSPEFTQRFGAPSHEGYVDLLYRNVLDRAPDAEGLAHHVKALAQGVDKSEIALNFVESLEFRSHVVEMYNQGIDVWL